MQEVYSAEFVSLHVRVSNRAAFTLYRSVLGFEINDVERGYYADKEDAYDMRKTFPAGQERQRMREREQRNSANLVNAKGIKLTASKTNLFSNQKSSNSNAASGASELADLQDSNLGSMAEGDPNRAKSNKGKNSLNASSAEEDDNDDFGTPEDGERDGVDEFAGDNEAAIEKELNKGRGDVDDTTAGSASDGKTAAKGKKAKK